MPARVLVDLHCHTQDHSYDGKIPAVELLQGVMAKGFSGLTFTDHSYCWPDAELAELRHRAALPPDFFLASGQEVRTAKDGVTIGDLLVFGVPENLPDGTSPLEIFRRIKETNGFCLAPHPGLPFIGLGDKLGEYPVLAAEVWNGRYGSKNSARASRLAQDHGIAEFGGSDAHFPKEIGGGGTELDRLPRSLEELHVILREGNSRAWIPGARGWLRRLTG